MSNNLFLKYPSLTNHYAIQKSRLISEYLFNGNKFYATEKIDGSNIQLSFNNSTREYAFYRRNGSFGDDEAPFNEVYNLVTPDDVNLIIDHFNELNPGVKNTVVHVYGELFGFGILRQGYTIAKEKSRSVRFYDIIMVNEQGVYTEIGLAGLLAVIPSKFLPYFINAGEEKPLKDWLEEKPSNESHYGGLNEGYVFKLVDSHEFNPESSYVGVKYKTDEFLEVAKVPKNKVVIEFANPELVADISRYVTRQRLMNIVSHGDVTLEFKNFPVLVKEMNADIIKEYTRDDNPNGYSEEEVTVAVNKALNKDITNVIRVAIKEA